MAIGMFLEKYLGKTTGGGSDLPSVSAADNGDVLTVVNGEWDKASPSGGGALTVNFTLNEQTQTVTADKTYEEVLSAYNEYKNIIGVIPPFSPTGPDTRLPLIGASGGQDGLTLIFEAVVWRINVGEIIGVDYTTLQIKPDNTVVYDAAEKNF